MVNVIAPIHTNENGLYLEPNFPLELYRAHAAIAGRSPGARANDNAPDAGRTPYLDACPTLATASIAIGVVNRHKDRALRAQLEILGAKPGRAGKVRHHQRAVNRIGKLVRAAKFG